jgi:hypothetical protein
MFPVEQDLGHVGVLRFNWFRVSGSIASDGMAGQPEIRDAGAASFRRPTRLCRSLITAVLRRLSRVLKNPFSPRLLKKIQMQGGTLKPERGVLEVRRSEW